MDFSKQLLQLQQSATRTRSRREDNGDGGRNDRDRDRDSDRNMSSHGHHVGRGSGRGGRSSSSYSRGGGDRRGGNDRGRYAPYDRNHGGRGYGGGRRPGGSGGSGSSGLTEAEEEYYLPRLVSAIPKYQPLRPRPALKVKQRHVALLFLTIDNLPFEILWRHFLDNLNANLNANNPRSDNNNMIVSVICHAKFPDQVTSPWLKQRLLIHKPSLRDLQHYKQRYNNNSHLRKAQYQNQNAGGGGDSNSNSSTGPGAGAGGENENVTSSSSKSNSNVCVPPVRYFSRRPEWGSIEITRAMIDLLEEALRIGTKRDTITSNVLSMADPTPSWNKQQQQQPQHLLSEKELDVYSDTYTSYRYVSTPTGTGTGTNDANHNMKMKNIGGMSMSGKKEPLPNVDRFLFLSETCLPVTTIQEFERELFQEAANNNPNPNKNDIRSNSRMSATKTKAATAIGKCQGQHYTGRDANKSWINARNTPNNGYARQLQWDAIYPREAIPSEHIWKADQWICLTRHHAWPILSLIEEAAQSVAPSPSSNNNNGGGNGNGNGNGRDYDRDRHDNRNDSRNERDKSNKVHMALWQCFKRMKASDEMYFPTVMSLLGVLSEDESSETPATTTTTTSADPMNMNKEIAKRRITYCDWSMSAKNPASFEIDRNESFQELKRVIRLAREEGCLFARKFTPPITKTMTMTTPGDPVEESSSASTGITGEEWLEIVKKISS